MHDYLIFAHGITKIASLCLLSSWPLVCMAQQDSDLAFNESGGERQVLKFNDYGATQGMAPPSDYGGFAVNRSLLRGFSNESALRNGYRDYGYLGSESDTANEGVEVYRGPASALFGNGKPGGDINKLAPQPDGERRRDVQASVDRYGFTSLRAELGDAGSQQASGIPILAYRLGLGADFGPGRRQFDEAESYGLSPSFAWQANAMTRLLIEFDAVRLRDQVQPDRLPLKPLIDFSQWDTLGEHSDWYIESGNTVRVSVEHTISPHWRIRQAFLGQRTHADIDTTELDVYKLTGETLLTEDSSAVRRVSTRRREHIGDEYSQSELYGVFDIGNVSNQMLLGIELGRYRFDTTGVIAPLAELNLANPVYGAQPGEFIDDIDQQYQNDSTLVYLQDRLKFSNQWQALLGLRAERLHANSNNRLTGVDSSGEDNLISPRLGVVYSPSINWSWFASQTRSSRPQLGALTADGSLLPPEEGRQLEAGVQWSDINTGTVAAVSLYRLQRLDLATTDSNNPNFSVASGKRQSRGIEFQLRGSIDSSTTIDLGVEVMRAKVLRDNDIPHGTALPGVAPWFANAWLTRQLDANWTLGGGVLGEGRRRADWPPNDLRLPSYLTVDLSLAYRGEGGRIQLGMGNVLARRALVSDGYSVDILESRSVSISFSAGFN
jgi:iron complex outermembrane recepter protein